MLLSWNYPTKVKYMIVRFIVFIIIFLFLWWLYRNIKVFIEQKSNSKPDTSPKMQQEDDMVQCAYCKIYTPKNHAIKGTKNHFFCSIEHKNQHFK
ncbi:PP0621 family protein [Marinomonas phaeophyticola]|uniref:PP0621 family protein n=1 Tax=Marinomonas phaeophyticola TaxID=3004091 RepID=UPI003D16B0A3